MGPSLRLPAPAVATPDQITSADSTQDFRGVVYPLNYVKTRMALSKLRPGQVLAVLLDEQGAQHVPASAASDGHAVLSVACEQNHWRVLLRKGKGSKWPTSFVNIERRS